jgi:hypothetical protein
MTRSAAHSPCKKYRKAALESGIRRRVDMHHVVELLHALSYPHIGCPLRLSNRRIIYQNLHRCRLQTLESLLHDLVAAIFIRKVSADNPRLAVKFLDLQAELLGRNGRVFVCVLDHYVGAAGGEFEGDAGGDAVGGTGYDGVFAFQREGSEKGF